MAKNKNRDRGKHQDRSSDERGAEQSSSSTDAKAEQIQQQVTPSDVAHKGRQKRFGHN